MSGSLWRSFGYHNRDWDLAHIVSSPVSIADWLQLEPSRNDTCGGNGHMCEAEVPTWPRRPPGLTGMWMSAAEPGIRANETEIRYCPMRNKFRKVCDRALYFERRGLPMGALPETLALAHIVRLTEQGAARDGDLTPCVIAAHDSPNGTFCAVPTLSASCAPYIPAVLSGRALPWLGVRLAPFANASPISPIRRNESAQDADTVVARELGWSGDARERVDWREYACSKRDIRGRRTR